ncbi:hydantoinase B/oxoprolinase family protein [Thermogymnomonas acidicola]|uniref:hydantoinase B/oxoprolinase family protein n=1 Tax=Thermogymnomonas acidicola TaxID=399579 RepID=UPI001494A97A|nr:hydantoinase B/oxoprolinase family protein [Thermogymnomonas acidicola]
MTELRTAGTNVDPFTREIIANGLRAAAEEMFYAFGKAARSPVIYETLDYASAITTPEGELVAQANGVPRFPGRARLRHKGPGVEQGGCGEGRHIHGKRPLQGGAPT